jgi:hypothetical protein
MIDVTVVRGRETRAQQNKNSFLQEMSAAINVAI